MLHSARPAIIAWSLWLQEHRADCFYSEGPNRYANLNKRGILPYVGDCSATIRNYFNWAGAPDPYRLGYNDPEGYTGTELAAGINLNRSAVVPGDAVVYGPGTGWHTALVVMRRGNDLLTVSMGQQGDPSFVWVSPPEGPSLGYPVDGREPQRFLTFPLLAPKVYFPAGYAISPTQALVRRLGFVRVSAVEAGVARANGWQVFGWNGKWFKAIGTAPVIDERLWAPKSFGTRKKG